MIESKIYLAKIFCQCTTHYARNPLHFWPTKKVYLVLGSQQVKLKDLIKIRSRSARSSSPVFNPDALLALGFPRQDKAVATIASPDVTPHNVDVTIEIDFLTIF